MIDIRPGLVSVDATQAVLRTIGLHIRQYGVTSEEISEWKQHPFPMLREDRSILAIARKIESNLHPRGALAKAPQIVWHWPDMAPSGYPLTPHRDVPPDGKRFTSVVGVALTRWTPDNGTLRVWSAQPNESYSEGREPEAIWLGPGDVIVLEPGALHSPGINYSGDIRCGLYFRWLEDIQPEQDR